MMSGESNRHVLYQIFDFSTKIRSFLESFAPEYLLGVLFLEILVSENGVLAFAFQEGTRCASLAQYVVFMGGLGTQRGMGVSVGPGPGATMCCRRVGLADTTKFTPGSAPPPSIRLRFRLDSVPTFFVYTLCWGRVAPAAPVRFRLDLGFMRGGTQPMAQCKQLDELMHGPRWDPRRRRGH